MFDVKNLEEAINLLKSIDELNLSEADYNKVINYLARKFPEVERYLEDNYQLLYRLQRKMEETPDSGDCKEACRSIWR